MQKLQLDFEIWNIVLQDPICSKLVDQKISKIHKQRLIFSKGGQLRRSSYDSLNDKGMLSAEFMVKEFLRIKLKQSALLLQDREYIERIVSDAIFQTVELYEKTAKVDERRKKRKEKVAANVPHEQLIHK